MNTADAQVEKDQEWTKMEVYFSAAGYLLKAAMVLNHVNKLKHGTQIPNITWVTKLNLLEDYSKHTHTTKVQILKKLT